MHPLNAVVLDLDSQIRSALVIGLREQDIFGIGEAAVPGDALKLCIAMSADLLLCGLPVGLQACLDLLHQIARMARPPAVSFHNAGADIAVIERLCLSLGLYYMGMLTLPLNAARLERMILQLRVHRSREEMT